MDNEKALIEAAKTEDIAAIRALLGSGADINCADEQGWTPLKFAAGKGNLEIVRLLVESGADIFKAGRDMRTPYMVALAAGRVSVAKYLQAAENDYAGEKPSYPERKYCKAYHLADLRKYPRWNESRINWKDKKENGNGGMGDALADDQVVFIHQDFTVTESMWRDENIIFNAVDTDWKKFCTDVLKFSVPDALSLVTTNEEKA